MNLSGRILSRVQGVNSWLPVSSPVLVSGQDSVLYIQLLDAETAAPGACPQRYVPAAGSTLSVRISNLDDDAVVSRDATQPFPGDASIWGLQLLSTDDLAGGAAIDFVLSEDGLLKPGAVAGIARTACSC